MWLSSNSCGCYHSCDDMTVICQMPLVHVRLLLWLVVATLLKVDGPRSATPNPGVVTLSWHLQDAKTCHQCKGGPILSGLCCGGGCGWGCSGWGGRFFVARAGVRSMSGCEPFSVGWQRRKIKDGNSDGRGQKTEACCSVKGAAVLVRRPCAESGHQTSVCHIPSAVYPAWLLVKLRACCQLEGLLRYWTHPHLPVSLLLTVRMMPFTFAPVLS